LTVFWFGSGWVRLRGTLQVHPCKLRRRIHAAQGPATSPTPTLDSWPVCMQKAPQLFLGGRMPSVARHFRSNGHCHCHCNSKGHCKGHCKGRSNGESSSQSSSQSSSYRRCRSRGPCPLPHPSIHPNLSRSRSLRQCCRSIPVPVPPAKPAYLPLPRLFPCAPTLCAGASCVGWQGPPPHGCGGGAYMGERALLARHCLACARTHSRQRLGRAAERDLQRALPTHTRRPHPGPRSPRLSASAPALDLDLDVAPDVALCP